MLKQTGVPEMDMSNDDRIRELARVREKARRDEISALANAEERGRLKERENILKALRATGVSEEQIEEVLKIYHNNKM